MGTRKHHFGLFSIVPLLLSGFMHSALAQETALIASTPWARDGERFKSYSFFRDELVYKLLGAKSRVAIITPLLADPDVATVLFTQRIKGLSVFALVDASRSRSFHSRHEYLARSLVPTHLVGYEKLLQAVARKGANLSLSSSFVIIDSEAWTINTWFEETPGLARESEQSQAGGSSREIFVEPSSDTADEIWSWQFNKGTRSVPVPSSLPNAGRFRNSKRPSEKSLGRRADASSQTIETSPESILDLPSAGPVPKKLPRETRLQKLKKGRLPRDSAGAQTSTGSSLVPPPPANESDVIE